MLDIDLWPRILSPRDLEWSPDAAVSSGGRSLSRLEQRDALDGGPQWLARMAQIPVYDRERILAFQALQMILVGGIAPIILERRPADRAPDPLAGGVPHSDGTPFSDDTLYEGGGVRTALVGATELRAPVVSFSYAAPRALLSGEDFSVYSAAVSWRMHRIKRLLDFVPDEDDSPGPGGVAMTRGVYTAEIGPNLRDDYDADTFLDFNNPRCVMKLSNPEAFRTALQFNRWGYVDAEFEEAFWKVAG